MESRSEREICRENGSRHDTNGTSLSWSVGTISPNVWVWMEESHHTSLFGGKTRRRVGLCNVLLPRGGDPSLWFGWYQLTAGIGPGLAMLLGSCRSGGGPSGPYKSGVGKIIAICLPLGARSRWEHREKRRLVICWVEVGPGCGCGWRIREWSRRASCKYKEKHL